MKKGFISVSVQMPLDRHKDLVAVAKKMGVSQAAFMRQVAYVMMDKMLSVPQ